MKWKPMLFIFALLLTRTPGLAQTCAVGQNCSGSLTAQDSGTCATSGACTTLPVPGDVASVVIQLGGTFSATVQFEETADGTNWVAASGTVVGSSSTATSATAGGAWRFPASGTGGFRARCSSFVSGSVTVTINASKGSASSASGGAVSTVGGGALTNTAIVTGGGGQSVQTPSATSTLDSSGNMIVAGNLTFGGVTLSLGSNGQTSGSPGLLNLYGNTAPTSGGQIHAGNNVLGTGAYWRGDPSTSGKFCFDTASQAGCGAGSAWAVDFTAVASNVTTVVPNANTALPQAFNTAGQIPVSFSASTGAFTGSATPSLGTDGSVAGSLQLANSGAAFHTLINSGATANNTITLFATAPATGDLIDCVTAGVICTLTDAGFLATNVVRKDTTNAAGTGMTLDLSGITGANAFKVPVIAGSTSGADGVVVYDSTNKNTHIRVNGADALAVGEALAVGAGVMPKASNGTQSLLTNSSISDNGTNISSTEVANLGNTQLLTTNSSGITATTPGTIIFTMSAMKASTNYAFHCAGTYSQASAAVADGVSVQGATNAPTRLDAAYNVLTSNAGASAQGNVVNLASTTQTALSGTFTPSGTGTNFNWYLDGVVQNGASATTLKIGFFTGNASDAVTINAGSYCSLNP